LPKKLTYNIYKLIYTYQNRGAGVNLTLSQDNKNNKCDIPDTRHPSSYPNPSADGPPLLSAEPKL